MKDVRPVIVVVAYNREQSLVRLLKSIQRATYNYDDITLIISIDWSNNIETMTQIANSFEWIYGEKKVVAHEENLGLRKHVIECGSYSEKYGAVIVLEDDLYVAEDFYNYATKAANYYYNEEKVCGVGLYSYIWNVYGELTFTPQKGPGDVYFGQFMVSWGQLWTDKQWKGFYSWYMKNQTLPTYDRDIPKDVLGWPESSWGKYFACYIVKNDLYYVIPYISRSTNFHETGVHSVNETSMFQVPLSEGVQNYVFTDFDDTVHYDIFFERKDTKWFSSDIQSNLTIDLNASRNLKDSKRYLLSTKRYPYKIVQSYGLRLRPADANLDHDIDGDGIYLYDLKGEILKDTRFQPLYTRSERVEYELDGYRWIDLLHLVKKGLIRDIQYIIKKKLTHK